MSPIFMCRNFTCRFSLCLLFLLVPLAAWGDIPTAPQLVLTSKENGLTPETQFSCSDLIHGYLTLPHKAFGKHELEARWTNLNGVTLQFFKTELDCGPNGRQTAYVYLRFAEIHPLGSLGIEKDEDKEDYSGRWTVDVLWDGKPLVKTHFDVRC